jgi:hypothetical protein
MSSELPAGGNRDALAARLLSPHTLGRATRIVKFPGGRRFAIVGSNAALPDRIVVPQMTGRSADFSGETSGTVGSPGLCALKGTRAVNVRLNTSPKRQEYFMGFSIR